MTISLTPITGQEGDMSKKLKISKSDMTLENEESKLDPLGVSGNSSFKAEGGLIL